MALTILEAGKLSSDVRRQGVIKLIAEASPMLQYVPMKSIKGNAYTYQVETALPGVAFRAVGDTYPQSTHVTNPVTERLSILGGEVFIDNFEINTQGNLGSVKAAAYAAKARAMGLVYSEKFLEGDSASNVREFDGVRVRLGSNQLITAGANGAGLTLAMLDQLIDKVIGMGNGSKGFFNKTLRRKLTELGRNFSGGYSLIDVGDDAFGHQVTKYNGVVFHIIERDDNEATFLDFDETVGTSSVTASIYVLRFGDRYISGIEGEGGSLEVKDFGEIQSAPGHLGRIEWYTGLCLMHPRCGARLRGVLNV